MQSEVTERDFDRTLTVQEGTDDEPIKEPVRQFLALALEQFQLVQEVESTMRQEMREDRRFRASDQWPDTIKNERVADNRPCLTINRIPEFVRQVTNAQRQNRPAVRVGPVDSGADKETAEVLQGIIRNIESQSDADVAYSHAGVDQVELGRGYWRILTERSSPRSFDQDIKIKRIANPFSVYMDPTTSEADCSDARYAFIVEDIPKRTFKQRFGNAAMVNLTQFAMMGDPGRDWMPEGKVRIAEYFYIEHNTRTLLELRMTPSTETTSMFEDEWSELVANAAPVSNSHPANWVVLDSAEVDEPTVMWCLISGAEILEGNEDKTAGRPWLGKYIPIVPVHGDEVVLNGERDYRGMIRDARDVQRMINYWESALTEQIALAPKSPFIIAQGQLKGHEAKWNSANRRNWPYLEYNTVDSGGKPVGAPQRQTSEPPIQATVLAANRADSSMQSVMGFHEASLGNMSQQERSGKAVLALQKQAELGSSNYLDNLGRAIRFSGRILVDLIPKIYSEQRILRILGEDDVPKQVMVHSGDPNAPGKDQLPSGIAGIYDLDAGRYDVVISVGRSFETRRQEATETLQELVKAYPEAFPLVADLMTENMDVPWARQVSARLKLLLPPAATEGEASEMPPAAMQAINQLKQQLEEQAQQLEEQGQQLATDRIKASGNLRIKQLDIESKEKVASQKTNTDLQIATLEGKIDLMIAGMKAEADARRASEAEDTKRGAAMLSAAEARTAAKNKPKAGKSA